MIIVLLLALLLTPAHATPAGVVVVGDSLARGAYASTPKRAYVALLDGTFVSARDLAGAEAASIPPARVVVLEVGINDTLSGPLTPNWEARYRALAEAIYASGAQLVCVTPFDIGVPEVAEDLAARAAAVRANCPGGRVADLYAVSWGRDDLRARIGDPTQYNTAGRATDGLHPNDQGHALIAALVRDALVSRTYLPAVIR